MKKLSLSVFAVLAIVMAVTSAYTTKEKKFANNFTVYGLQPNTYTSISATDAESQTLVKDNGTVDQSISTTFSQTAASDGCNFDNTFQCAVEVKTVNGSTKTINESVLGDFHQ